MRMQAFLWSDRSSAICVYAACVPTGAARLPHAFHVAIEALAFALQMTLAYWLMLIVMTYE